MDGKNATPARHSEEGDRIASTPKDELTIRIVSNYTHKSEQSEKLKLENQSNSPSLTRLFEKTLKTKNEFDTARTHWVEPNEVVVEGLSQMTLQDFIMKAERLGKRVSYSKSLTVKITD